MLRPSPNHGTLRLHNADDDNYDNDDYDDDEAYYSTTCNMYFIYFSNACIMPLR